VRTFSLSYKNIKLTDRDLLRDFVMQQDMGVTAFLFKHPTEALTKYVASNQDAVLELTNETTGNLGQGFKVPVQTVIHKVDIYLKKTGSPSGQLTLNLETDSSGKPSGTVLDTSDNVAVSSVGASFALVTFNFATPVRLEAFTQYHLVLEGDSTYDSSFVTGTTVVEWGVDASSPTYANGSISTYATGSWTQDATKCAIFTMSDYVKVETEESAWAEERISGAEGGIFNVGVSLIEAI
jgi:hypothetical protein